MLDKKNLFELAKVVANANPSSQVAYSFGDDKFNYSQLNDTLRNELNELAGNYQLYRENKNLIFSLIEDTIDDVLPRKVMEQYSMFADVKVFGQGDKPVFTQRVTNAAKRRAKQFITKVGLAGRYEVFKLDGRSYEIPTEAYGGAAQIGFEEFLDGRVNFADVLDIVMEGLDEAIYKEIEKSLKAAVTNLQAANKKTETTFVEKSMDDLLSIADSYGRSAIYCTFEFAATMKPDKEWASDAHKNQMWANGYITDYKGHNVIVLPQSYEDETNAVKVIDPSHCYIIPTGAEKPVKIAIEGQTAVRELENEDWSREVQVYKKLGVGAVITNNICVYINSSLQK
jgi:hypothetical protein